MHASSCNALRCQWNMQSAVCSSLLPLLALLRPLLAAAGLPPLLLLLRWWLRLRLLLLLLPRLLPRPPLPPPLLLLPPLVLLLLVRLPLLLLLPHPLRRRRRVLHQLGPALCDRHRVAHVPHPDRALGPAHREQVWHVAAEARAKNSA